MLDLIVSFFEIRKILKKCLVESTHHRKLQQYKLGFILMAQWDTDCTMSNVDDNAPTYTRRTLGYCYPFFY